jgi:L-iditol 2-dehydrogenase
VTGSWVYNSFEYPYAYHLIQPAERIGIPVTSLITHRFPLDRIQSAFDASLSQDGIKVVVEAQS